MYEYIFDLEQQIAYQKEEIPKITCKIEEELRENYQKQLEEMEEEKEQLIGKEEEIGLKLEVLGKEKEEVDRKLEQTQN